MPKFQKGSCPNPKGRPKGAKDKVSPIVRELISGILKKELPIFYEEEYPKLKPEFKMRFLLEILPFDTAKLSNVSNTWDFENMDDETIQKIIDSLMQKAEEKSNEH